MQPAHPPAMTMSDLQSKWETVLLHFTDPAHHLSGILFPAGHDCAEIVMVPFQEGILHLEHWLAEPRLLNLYASSAQRTDIVGIRRKTFYRFPTSRAIPFTHAYTIFYWTQQLTMPVNKALTCYCVGSEEYRLLRGNVLVLKHRQSSCDGYENMTSSDIALVGSIIGSAVSIGFLDSVDEHEFAMEVIEL